MILQNIKEKIEKVLNISLYNCKHIAQNSVADIYNCDNKYLVKHSNEDWLLESEEEMLEYLAEFTNLRVPKVIEKRPNLLITEYIRHDSVGRHEIEEDAAFALATLHRITGERYGLFMDTTIGPFVQSNEEHESWIEFFKRERLLDFANKALEEGVLPGEIYDRLITFCEHLGSYLEEPDAPSLLHGDIWSGNVLVDRGELVGFIDPAIYYGHHEVELAFIRMFETFGDRFFRKYHEMFPIKEGFFEERCDIYNLYPYLVHLRSFGKSYLSYIERILKKYGH